MSYKTPGVYLEEASLFPPSVAALATAVPAFVGYTEKTGKEEEGDLINQPKKITSLLEFKALFGGSYNPEKYKVTIKDIDSLEIEKIEPIRNYYLYDSIRHYFDNGGGPCYVVSVGNYTNEISLGKESDMTELLGGLNSLRQEEEPTLLLIPDSMLLEKDKVKNIYQKILTQAADLQDRFGILDVYKGNLSKSDSIEDFRDKIGTENLNYAAAYYPWLYTTYKKEVHFTQLEIVDKNDQKVDLSKLLDDNGLIENIQKKIDGEEEVLQKQTDDFEINRYDDTTLNKYFEELNKKVENSGKKSDLDALMKFIRQVVLAFPSLEGSLSDSSIPLLNSLKADTSLQNQLKNLIGFEKKIANAELKLIDDDTTDYDLLFSSGWLDGDLEAIDEDATTNYEGNKEKKRRTAANSTVLYEAFAVIAEAYKRIIKNVVFQTDQAEAKLFQEHPFYKMLYTRIQKDMSLLPPSGAIAGIYAKVDRERGVWKAPANISINSIVGLAVKLNDREQADLNIHSTGKSINAIRQFTGRGTLVWGARTLDGNSKEWQYINVRRFFIMVEEAAKKASQQFVFESNDANTWVKMRAMLENFLMQQWRDGALTGAKPEDAYYVKVGLGQTMTVQDILEGKMILEIGMAVVRPAEFIILRFSHKMQEA